TLEYAPGTRVMRCPYCGSEQHLGEAESDDASLVEHLLHDVETAPIQTETVRIIACQNCGAQTRFDPTAVAQRCAFCASPLVAEETTIEHLRPDAILPMTLTRDEARTAVTRWKSRIWFAPNGFADQAKLESALQPLYLPFWSVDAETKTHYRGERGKDTNHKNRGNRTEWRTVKGTVELDFDDYILRASPHISERLATSLNPWDLTVLERYEPAFLAGFSAEVTAQEPKDALAAFKKAIQPLIKSAIRRDIGGEKQRITSHSTKIWGLRYRQVLLPVWLGAYRYRGKVYQVALNGRTGRVSADRPWSWVKITLAVIAALAVAAIIALGVELLDTLLP
ncbi:MAG: hypothetical protein AAFQ36_12110, partial [Pseudomonadota bacterium]